jgi:uncharacterized membrane protein SpoIIM required for sporulation
MAILFSLVGIRLISGMPYLDGLGYMLLHMFIAWWSVSSGAWVVRYIFRSWQPPVVAICIMGFIVSIIPAVFLFQHLGEYYASMYQVFAINRGDVAAPPSWSITYLLHFIRYSIPAVPIFLAGVFGYRYIAGVTWFGYGPPERVAAPVDPAAAQAPVTQQELAVAVVPELPLAGLIEGTKLPADAILLAVRAEQHYIRIWSDRGTDMVRYRFRDLMGQLGNCPGGQVHRSWWVNFDAVQSVNNEGRKLELTISPDLIVPVSVSYRNSVVEKLNSA